MPAETGFEEVKFGSRRSIRASSITSPTIKTRIGYSSFCTGHSLIDVTLYLCLCCSGSVSVWGMHGFNEG